LLGNKKSETVYIKQYIDNVPTNAWAENGIVFSDIYCADRIKSKESPIKLTNYYEKKTDYLNYIIEMNLKLKLSHLLERNFTITILKMNHDHFKSDILTLN
jgi:hypothetical protein